MTIDVSVREMTACDGAAVLAIYEEGIATRNATFETVVPESVDWDAGHLNGHHLVACTDAEVVGWAALSPVSDRCVYAGVAENSVYVAAAARGRGVGRLLLDSLVRRSEAAEIWTLQTGSSRKTPPESAYTSRAASVSSESASALAVSMAAGATRCSWSDAAHCLSVIRS